MDNKRCQVLCCTLNVAWPASVCTVPRLAATLMRLPFPCQHHLTVLPDQHHLTVLPSVIRFGAVIYFHKPTNKTGTNHAGSGSHSPNVLRRSSHSGIRHRTLKNYLY